MATIKSYTDLEQSKKLAEILPLESADMHYYYNNDFGELESIPTITEEDDHYKLFPEDVRCWSLAALLSVMPTEIVYKGNIIFLEFHVWENSFEYVNGADYTLYVTESHNNPIDACVAMIEKLHELNLL